MFIKIKQNWVYLLDVLFFTIMLILPGNSYQWMQNLGVNPDELPVDNNLNFKVGLTLLFLLVLVAIHGWFIFKTKLSNLQLNLNIVFLALVCLSWVFKFVI